MSRLRYIRGCEEAVAESPYVIHSPEDRYFENDAPLQLEIGMGKGRFIMDMAGIHPENNYIGVERYESVLLRGIQKYGRLVEEGRAPDNLLFLCEDAGNLDTYFAKGSIDRIFLNFSDPWPKDRHAHRRLVCAGFLRRFHGLLAKEGRIEFKTDNDALFEYAMTQLEPSGFDMVSFTRDLHADPVLGEGNIMTEYEEKFSLKGNKISKMIITKKE